MWTDGIPERDMEEPTVKPINARCRTAFAICPKCGERKLWYSKALGEWRCMASWCRYIVSD